ENERSIALPPAGFVPRCDLASPHLAARLDEAHDRETRDVKTEHLCGPNRVLDLRVAGAPLRDRPDLVGGEILLPPHPREKHMRCADAPYLIEQRTIVVRGIGGEEAESYTPLLGWGPQR